MLSLTNNLYGCQELSLAATLHKKTQIGFQ